MQVTSDFTIPECIDCKCATCNYETNKSSTQVCQKYQPNEIHQIPLNKVRI